MSGQFWGGMAIGAAIPIALLLVLCLWPTKRMCDLCFDDSSYLYPASHGWVCDECISDFAEVYWSSGDYTPPRMADRAPLAEPTGEATPAVDLAAARRHSNGDTNNA